MSKVKKEFWFDPAKFCTGKLVNEGGDSCVIGQFLNKMCKIAKSKLMYQEPQTSYDLFSKRTGLRTHEAYFINDNCQAPIESKITMFRKLFEKTPYTFKVKGIDDGTKA